MIEKLIEFSIKHRWLVVLAAIAIAALGVYNYQRLPIDAVPDITNVQVQINTGAPGYSPLEVEQRITFPIETAMSGLPNLEYTRSLSRYGLSQVTVIFKDGTDIYLGRQHIAERLSQVKESAAQGVEVADGADLHRPRRNLHVDRGREARREETGRLCSTRRPTCASSRIGSSNRSSATCPASSR